MAKLGPPLREGHGSLIRFEEAGASVCVAVTHLPASQYMSASEPVLVCFATWMANLGGPVLR